MALHSTTVIARASGSEAELCLLPLIMMVPIDSSRQELSNGCHFVFWSNFDFHHEIPAAAVTLPLPAAF